jgi:hypothetical protein
MSVGPPVDQPIHVTGLYPRQVNVPPNFKLGKPLPTCIPEINQICMRKYAPGPQRFICTYRAGCLPGQGIQQFRRCLNENPDFTWGDCAERTNFTWAMTPVASYYWPQPWNPLGPNY